jgi:hypothetical protein
MLVAVPSKGRAGMVRTQTVLPNCSVFVPALEAEAYRKAGSRNVVAVPNDVQGNHANPELDLAPHSRPLGRHDR